jgi:hypothetical protein
MTYESAADPVSGVTTARPAAHTNIGYEIS